MSSTHPVRLACQTCAQRKVRCDKRSPCTNCLKHGISCIIVERRRLPRGRPGKQAPGLHGEFPNDEHFLPDSLQLKRRIKGRPRTGEKSSKVQHQNLHESSPGPLQRKEAVNLPQLPCLQPAFGDREVALLGRSVSHTQNKESMTDPGHTASSSLHTRKTLLKIYFRQVDPIFKILHRPSLSAFIMEERPYLNYDRGHPAPMALASAISYLASSTLSEEQSIALFCESRETMITKYKNETKSALMKLDFLATNEMTVLQAFVLSLIAARLYDRSRRVWTMLSIALRIAQALSLHLVDPPFLVRPFEREMRRRLWHVIGWLDIEASIDRASEPMMSSMWIQPHALSNVNDEEFGFYSKEILQSTRSDPTDTTLLKMVSHAQGILRSFDLSNFAEPGISDVWMRQQIVYSSQHEVDILLARCEAPTSAFHWFLSQLKDRIYDALRLFALQPMRREAMFFTTYQADGGIISLAGDILEKRQKMYNDSRAQPWRWFEKFFFPWHALAVALTEVSTSAERLMVDRYWPAIENSYTDSLQLAGDSPHGLAGKSMEDLMRDARAAKEAMSCNDKSSVTNTWPITSMDTGISNNRSSGHSFDSQQWLPPVVGMNMPQTTHPQGIDPWDQFEPLFEHLPDLDFEFPFC